MDPCTVTSGAAIELIYLYSKKKIGYYVMVNTEAWTQASFTFYYFKLILFVIVEHLNAHKRIRWRAEWPMAKRYTHLLSM